MANPEKVGKLDKYPKMWLFIHILLQLPQHLENYNLSLDSHLPPNLSYLLFSVCINVAYTGSNRSGGSSIAGTVHAACNFLTHTVYKQDVQRGN